MRAAPFGRLCAALLRLSGWRVRVAWPPVPKAVAIFYPHTSNRDFVIGILARHADKRGRRPENEGEIRFG